MTIFLLFFGQEHCAVAAFSQLMHDGVFVEVVIVVLVFEDVLLVKVEASPAETQRTRSWFFGALLRVGPGVEKSLSHLASRTCLSLLKR